MGSKEKKRPKKAFQGRNKKRDRGRSRKKGSKKPRRLEDSYSQSNDDSSSAYSSEELVKRRSSRSQVRKDGKGRKRKARSSSSSSYRSFKSPRAKKIKRLKRKAEGGKKKAGKKNKRALSVSSASSDESDYEKSRGISKKKAIDRRYGKEGKSMRGSKKYRSLSYSSSSSGSASEGERKRKRERSPGRSSLSISSESERERKRYWSPSSLSGRSASGDQHIQDELEVQNKSARKLRSIIVVPEIPDQDTMSDEHEYDFAMRDENDEWSTKSNIADRDEQIKESIDRTEVMLSVPDDEDLESILRRKALENLRRFKGGPKKAGKSDKMETSVQEMQQMRESENVADLEDIGASDMKHSFSSDEESYLIIEDSSKVVDQVSTLVENEVYATPSRAMENASVKHHVEIEMGGSESAQLSNDNKVVPKAAAQIADNSSPALPADTKSNSGDAGASKHITISHTGKPVSDSFLMSQEPVAACPTMDPELPPPECLEATPELSKYSEDKRDNVPIEKVKPKSVCDSVEPSAPYNPSSSLPINVAGDHASSQHQAEAKESLQFQEKTVSVMRGGELVQVSYKVYIPKKPPAAARRRLKR